MDYFYPGGIAKLFSLSSNDVVILVSYNRFSVSFNLKHYQISKDLSSQKISAFFTFLVYFAR